MTPQLIKMVLEARDDDMEEDIVITETGSSLMDVVGNLKGCLEELVEMIENQKEGLGNQEEKEASFKALHNELNLSVKKNEQLDLEIEQLRILLAESQETSHSKSQEIERLVSEVEKFQCMFEEQAEMVGKYSDMLETEKVS